MEFGKKLLEFRANHNITQNQLGKIIGVEKCAVCKYESGKHKPTKKNEIVYSNRMKEWEENKNVSL